MKIGLISPKGPTLSKDKNFLDFWDNSKEISFYKDYWSGPSTGLLTIASLTNSSHEIHYFDEVDKPIDFDFKFDLVGISANTQQAIRAYQISRKFQEKGVYSVLGGLHATLLPEEASQNANTIICGEAEYLWPKFLEDFRNKKAQKIYKSITPVNLEDSPVPRYDLISHRKNKLIWIQTSRGCPHDCDFCAASKIYGKNYRYKPVKNALNEIVAVRNILGNITIGFSDDNFFTNKNRARELLEQIIPLKIRYICQTDISFADDDAMLALACKSGCIMALVGLESVDQVNLNSIDTKNWKHNKFVTYPERIAKIQSFGIGVFGTFIIGLDHDDSSIGEKTSKFIIDNNLFGAQLTILTPFPGTRLRDRLEKEKRITSSNWENYTAWNTNIIPKGMSADELNNTVLQIYKDIYEKNVYQKRIKHFKNIQKSLIEKGIR
jgi:radical SAM superfamily enzyme YgiQ (UPF0313 family)